MSRLSMKRGATLLAGVVVLWTAVAQAQDSGAAVEEIIALNRKALRAYDGSNFQAAKAALLEALVVGKEAELDSHPMMARTYLHLGVVFAGGLKDRKKASRYFLTALRIRPEITMTPSITGAAVNALFKEAQAAARSEQASELPADPSEPLPSEPLGSESQVAGAGPLAHGCPIPDAVPSGRDVELRCALEKPAAASRVLVYFRKAGEEDFRPVPARRMEAGWYQATIPAKEVVGKWLHYYIEARDKADQAAAVSGRPDSPNLVMIHDRASSGQERLRPIADLVDENPLLMNREPETASRQRAPGAVWMGVGAGSGLGWHPTKLLEYRRDLQVGSGARPSGLVHFLPEIGYQVTDRFALSIQGRHQLIVGQGSDDRFTGSPATAAHAVLARALYHLWDGDARMFVAGIAGGGQGFRLVVPPQPFGGVDGELKQSDTVRGGPVVLGGGLGFLYHFNETFAYSAELRLLVGVGDIAATADLSTGLQVTF
jgi:hypothetical protein